MKESKTASAEYSKKDASWVLPELPTRADDSHESESETDDPAISDSIHQLIQAQNAEPQVFRKLATLLNVNMSVQRHVGVQLCNV